ncbi:MAG: response regulator [Candidatus Tectomicrobia bacterium]|uniref:Response regulator n=1 Tax=Tectimicrobiota bacterium TaxID=2528274 RepID=A0A932CLR3_UNCTE|nr:response regulator [Candidatus Tectomicrobia bacterium]
MKTENFPGETPPERILILDDEEYLAEALKIILEPRYQVDTANDGLNALELIRAMDYDLIISDLMMPRMNGVELYGQVKRERPGLEKRILFISGSLDNASREFLEAAGSLFLPKPFSIIEFLEVVNHFFTTHQLNHCPSGSHPPAAWA